MKQNTPEWHAMRRSKIGASDVPIILGVSPYKTPLQLFNEKTGRVSSNAPTPAMLNGHEMEPAIISHAEDVLACSLFPTVVFHPEHSWLMASIDGLSLDRTKGAEVKAWGKDRMARLRKGEVPMDTWMQCQIHMECARLDSELLVAAPQGSRIIQSDSRPSVFDAENIVAHVMVSRDKEWFTKILPKLKAFYDCIINDTPPAETDRDVEERSDPDWETLATEIRELENITSQLGEKLKEKRSRLIALAEGRSCKGAGVALTRYERKGAINYGAIPELKDIDLEPYRKETTTQWRLTIEGASS